LASFERASALLRESELTDSAERRMQIILRMRQEGEAWSMSRKIIMDAFKLDSRPPVKEKILGEVLHLC
jgi:hypothetical protein